ncbi:MAG: histidinol dehydrogenase, partial [Deltaproteobacteria bacterium]|nr:histidinol dehydrogenase [Deltaproteobacteria bacterium]
MRLLRTRDADFEAAFHALEQRRQRDAEEVGRAVSEIVDDVRRRGDDALLDATERFDGYRLAPAEIVVSSQQMAAGAARLGPEDRDALGSAAERIRAFHSLKLPQSWQQEREGEVLGQLVRPLASVGLYVPAFKAPLASTVLMLGIPAAVAGVP